MQTTVPQNQSSWQDGGSYGGTWRKRSPRFRWALQSGSCEAPCTAATLAPWRQDIWAGLLDAKQASFACWLSLTEAFPPTVKDKAFHKSNWLQHTSDWCHSSITHLFIHWTHAVPMCARGGRQTGVTLANIFQLPRKEVPGLREDLLPDSAYCGPPGFTY